MEQLERAGQPILGSRLLRNYCVSCGEPIRVTMHDWFLYGPNVYCTACEPNRKTKVPATPRRDKPEVGEN